MKIGKDASGLKRDSTRYRPCIDTEMLSKFLGLSKAALTKRIQRGDFPEPAGHDGRKRLWSFAQMLDLMDEDTRNSFAAHIALDPFVDHDVKYLGASPEHSTVEFWFLVDETHYVVFAHESFLVDAPGARPEMVSNNIYPLGSDSSDGRPVSVYTLASVRNKPLDFDPTISDLDVEVEFSDYPFTVGRIVSQNLVTDRTLAEAALLVGCVVPVWPEGMEDPSLMVDWSPGKTLEREGLLTWRQGAESLLSPINETWLEYKRQHQMLQARARKYTFGQLGADDVAVTEESFAALGAEIAAWPSHGSDTVEEDRRSSEEWFLMLERNDDLLDLMYPDGLPPLGLQPAADGAQPKFFDEWTSLTVGSYFIAKQLFGLRRGLLDWGTDHQARLWVRTPETKLRPAGRWWHTASFPGAVALLGDDDHPLLGTTSSMVTNKEK